MGVVGTAVGEGMGDLGPSLSAEHALSVRRLVRGCSSNVRGSCGKLCKYNDSPNAADDVT